MTFEEARGFLLERAQAQGVEVEVLAEENRELSIKAFHGRLEEVTQATQGGVGVRVVVSGKTGYAYSEERSEEALGWALQEARENAELQDETGGFLPAGGALGRQDIIGEGLSAPVEEKSRRALEVEARLREDDRVKQVGMAGYMEREWTLSLASTGGVSGGYRNGAAAMGAMVTMQRGESLKQGWHFDWAKELHSLEPGRTALDALEKTGRLLGARPLKTGRYTAYFEPKVFAQLLTVFATMLSGKAVMEGKSRLGDKLGHKVASEAVTLVDDPLLTGGLAKRPFDAEGTPAQSVTLIEQGVLKSFMHNSATAKALGQANTGHAARSYKGTLGVSPSNLYLQQGSGLTPQQGIIVTDLSGLHAGANPISGDVSVQGLGLFVEGGEVAYPVENFALSGNFLELLARISGLGDSLEWEFYGVAVGAPLVEVPEMSFAGA